MARHKKAAARTAPAPVAADSVGALLADTLAELRGQLAVVQERRRALEPGHFDPDLAAAAASLARAVSQTAAQARLQERHDAAMRPQPTTSVERQAVIRAHFEALPRPDQVETARALTQMAGDGTLLGR